MDHDADTIAADYALSEKLGAELLLSLGAPAAVDVTVPVKRYFTTYRRHVNLLTGEVNYERVTVEI